jgi:hypothetical protein
MSAGQNWIAGLHCKKKVSDIPVPSRDVINLTLPGGNNLKLFPATEGLVSDMTSRLGTGKLLTIFYSGVLH